MNKIEIEGGGFPGTSKTWRYIRDMIYQVHDLAAMIGGDTYIISGCKVSGSKVSDGIVVINRQVMPFKGGVIQNFVGVFQNVEKTMYLKDDNNDGQGDLIDTYFEQYAKFANSDDLITAIDITSWSNLIRLKPVKDLQNRIVPLNTALPYWGLKADIPKGWQLCDGTNNTPDLRGKFLVGKSNETEFKNVGKTGGAKQVTLAEIEMPNHNHNVSIRIPPHKHDYRDRYMTEYFSTGGVDGTEFAGNNLAGTNGDNDNRYFFYKNSTTSSSGGQTISTKVVNKGGNRPHQNLPPYYTLAYITYIG